MSGSTGYGAIESQQATEITESDHPASTPIPSGTSNIVHWIKDVLERPWVRAAAALSLVLIMVFSSHRPAPSSGLTLTIADASGHDEDQELFYADQLVNHFNGDKSTWSNRYYKSTSYFKGPGHPIFLVIGGEGALDHGMLYPFVTQHLASHFGAAVIQIEHRFYGPYQPITGRDATVRELIDLLTTQQAVSITYHLLHDVSFVYWTA